MALTEQILSLAVVARDDASAAMRVIAGNIAAVGQAAQDVADPIANASDQVRVQFVSSLDSANVAAQNTADILKNQLGGALANVGDVFETNRTKIREFSRAGSELAIVASFLGNDFKQALGPVGEFIHVAGDAGLVLSTVVDLGPLAAGAIKNLGLESAAAAVQVEALALAESNVATKANPLILLLAGVGTGFAAGASGAFSFSSYTDKVNETLSRMNPELINSRGKLFDVGGAFEDVRSAVEKALQALEKHREKMNADALATEYASGYFRQFTTDAGETGAGLDNVAQKAIAAANGLDVTNSAVTAAGNAAATAAGQFNSLADAQAQFARSANIANGGVGPGAEGPGSSGLQEGQGLTSAQYGALEFNASHPSPVTTHVRAARAAVAATHAAGQALSDAFATAKQQGDDYFRNLHDAHLKALQDAKDLADAQIKAARAANDAALAAKLAADAVPVTNAEKALQATQNAEQERNLREALVNAQAGGNFTAIRSAQEALANFEAQRNIDQLRDTQATNDAKAQKDHDAANAALNAKQAALDAQYGKDVEHENAVYALISKAYDQEESALATHLANVKASNTRAHNEIERLWSTFHIPASASRPIVINLDGKTIARYTDEQQYSYARQAGPTATAN